MIWKLGSEIPIPGEEGQHPGPSPPGAGNMQEGEWLRAQNPGRERQGDQEQREPRQEREGRDFEIGDQEETEEVSKLVLILIEFSQHRVLPPCCLQRIPLSPWGRFISFHESFCCCFFFSPCMKASTEKERDRGPRENQGQDSLCCLLLLICFETPSNSNPLYFWMSGTLCVY